MSDQGREALIVWALKGYRHRRDYDDILQIGRIAAWKSLQDRPDLNPKVAIVHGARWAVSKHLRQRWVKVEEPMDHASPQWPRQQAGDFAPRLIERLSLDQEARAALAAMTTREEEVVLRTYWLGQNDTQAGREMGMSHDRVYALRKRGLKRAREAAQKGTFDV